MKNKTQFRQGDVLIQRVDIKIAKLTKPKGRVILAHGEATGHAHEVNEVQSVAHFAPDDNMESSAMILSLTKDADVKHQEHAPIPLPKGKYRVTRQVEYTPEAIQIVTD